MKTVHEISKLTGISVRTLHYYDEIGLLKPTRTSPAGYRLYDDKALELLQQILFFKEFDMPLKEIKAILEDPDLDRAQLFYSQKQALLLKKARLERIISSIDDILKGENKMDFAIFNQDDIQKMYRAAVHNLSQAQRDSICHKFGGMEQFQAYFLDSLAGQQAQEGLAKMVQWYGGKDSALSVMLDPLDSKIVEAYSKRMNAIWTKLAAKIGTDVTAFEVKEIVGELDFVAKQFYRMKDVSELMLDVARQYQSGGRTQEVLDRAYGPGAAAYMGQALEAFYAPKPGRTLS